MEQQQLKFSLRWHAASDHTASSSFFKMMAIRGKGDDPPIDWNVDMEVQLFYAMRGHKPVGVNRHFQMACIHEKLRSSSQKDITSQQIWDHLESMYDMAALDESEILPFPNDETDFVLPETDFGCLGKKEIHPSKKSIQDEDGGIKSTTTSSVAAAVRSSRESSSEEPKEASSSAAAVSSAPAAAAGGGKQHQARDARLKDGGGRSVADTEGSGHHHSQSTSHLQKRKRPTRQGQGQPSAGGVNNNTDVGGKPASPANSATSMPYKRRRYT